MQGARDLLIRYISPALPLWALVPNILTRIFGGGHYMLWDLRTGSLCCCVFVFARFVSEDSPPIVMAAVSQLPSAIHPTRIKELPLGMFGGRVIGVLDCATAPWTLAFSLDVCPAMATLRA